MKTYRSNPLIAGFALILSLATIVVGEEAAEPVEAVLDNPVGTVPIPAEIDQKTAMITCINAAIGREWNIVSKEDNLIKIHLRHRSWDATVYFLVRDDVIELYSDSYVVDKKTEERKEKKDPEGWIDYLMKDIKLVMAMTVADLRAGVSTEPVLDNLVATVPIPAQIDQKTAMDTCVNAAIGRGWYIESKEDNLIRISLKQRSWNATLYCLVKDEMIEMYSDTYVVNRKTGERKKKKNPDLWIKNLKKDISSYFDKRLFYK